MTAKTNKLQQLFVAAFVAGLSGLVFGTMLGAWWLSIIVTVASLIVYVFVGYRINDGHVPAQQFGDSAYYLGFLFTLAALMISMFVLGLDETDVRALLGRFATALLTTMIGLVARMWIVNLSGTTDGSLESAQQSLAQQTERFRQELEGVTTGLVGEGYRVQESVGHLTEEMASETKAAMQRATATLTESVAQASSTLSKKAEEAFSAGEGALRAGFERLEQSFSQLEQTLADQTAQLHESFQELVRKVSATRLPEDVLSRHLQPALDQLGGSVRGLVESTDQIGKALDGIKDKTGRIEREVGGVGVALEDVRGTCEGAARSLGDVRELGDALGQMQQRIGGLAVSLEELLEQLAAHTNEQSRLGDAHRDQVQALEDHVRQMKEALAEADSMVAQVGREMVAAANFVRRELERT